MDPTGRIEGRVWSDVELLDRRFHEGDAVRVLARVEKFRDRLQLDVRSLEPAQVEAAALVPEARRDLDELDGFLEFLAEELAHPGLRSVVGGFVVRPTVPRAAAGAAGDAEVATTPTRAACSSTRSRSPRSAGTQPTCTSGCAATS